MRLGIKGKQVLGVTPIVGAVVVVLSADAPGAAGAASASTRAARAPSCWPTRSSSARARSSPSGADPYAGAARRSGPALDPRVQPLRRRTSRSRRSSTRTGMAVVARRSDARRAAAAGRRRPRALLARPPLVAAARDLLAARDATSSSGSRCCSATREFGSIRIGVSTLLIRRGSERVAAPGARRRRSSRWRVAVFGAMLLAQLLLRPIHVIRSGLTRLGKGEFGVRLDLEPGRRVRRARHVLQHGQRAAVGRPLADGRSGREPRVGRRAPRGRRGDRQPEGRAAVRESGDARAAARRRRPARRSTTWCRPDHPLRRLVEQTLVSRQSRGPLSATFAVGRRRARRAADPDACGQRRRRASSSASC